VEPGKLLGACIVREINHLFGCASNWMRINRRGERENCYERRCLARMEGRKEGFVGSGERRGGEEEEVVVDKG
jgi:hypothetical protein